MAGKRKDGSGFWPLKGSGVWQLSHPDCLLFNQSRRAALFVYKWLLQMDKFVKPVRFINPTGMLPPSWLEPR